MFVFRQRERWPVAAGYPGEKQNWKNENRWLFDFVDWFIAQRFVWLFGNMSKDQKQDDLVGTALLEALAW